MLELNWWQVQKNQASKLNLRKILNEKMKPAIFFFLHHLSILSLDQWFSTGLALGTHLSPLNYKLQPILTFFKETLL